MKAINSKILEKIVISFICLIVLVIIVQSFIRESASIATPAPQALAPASSSREKLGAPDSKDREGNRASPTQAKERERRPLSAEDLKQFENLRSILVEELSKVEHQQGKLVFESRKDDMLTAITVFEEPVDEKYEAFVDAAQKILDSAASNPTIYPRLREEVSARIREFTSYPFPYKIVKGFLDSEGKGNITEGFSAGEPKIADGVVVSGYSGRLLFTGGLNSTAKLRYGYLFEIR